jgi:hypothetical protein
MKVSAIVATLALAALLHTTDCQANLITNGSFETADLTGWSSTGGNVVAFTGESGRYSLLYGAVGVPSYLYQAIATIPGKLYTFSFWQKTLGGTLNEFQAYWGDTKILDMVNTPVSDHYTGYCFNEIASSSSTIIKFGLRNDPAWDRLDDVRVEVSSAAPVPEPSSILLVGAGIVSLAVFRRRYRKSKPL